MNDNIMTYSTLAGDRENETMRESENITELEMICEQPEQTTGREQIAMNVNQTHSTATRDRRCKEDGAERESGDIQVERVRLETVKKTRNQAGGEQIAVNVNQSYSTVRDRRCNEDEAERESGDIQVERVRLETVKKTRNQAGEEQIAVNVNQSYSTVRDRMCNEDEAERESGDTCIQVERVRLETVKKTRNQAGGEQIAVNVNQAYSTVRDRMCNEDEAERESGDTCIQVERVRLETVKKTRNQAGGEQIAVNVNQAYSTVRDRMCNEDEAERESGDACIQVERVRLETVEMIWNQAGGEQIAVNVNQAYSTVRDRMCNEDEAERESGDACIQVERVRLETVEMIWNQAGGEQMAMNVNQSYSTVTGDKRQKECEAEIKSGGELPEEGLRLEPVEVIHDKPELLATDEELLENMACSEQAGGICDQLQNEKVLEKTAPTERQDWCNSWRVEWL